MGGPYGFATNGLVGFAAFREGLKFRLSTTVHGEGSFVVCLDVLCQRKPETEQHARSNLGSGLTRLVVGTERFNGLSTVGIMWVRADPP